MWLLGLTDIFTEPPRRRTARASRAIKVSYTDSACSTVLGLGVSDSALSLSSRRTKSSSRMTRESNTLRSQTDESAISLTYVPNDKSEGETYPMSIEMCVVRFPGSGALTSSDGRDPVPLPNPDRGLASLPL